MDTQESGQWAIVEIMGHKVVAGYITQAVQFGLPMLRIDVPATSIWPAFTRDYGAQAIYAITYVSEEVARMTAEASKVNPVAVYVPDLSEMKRAQLENERLRQEICDLRALPEPSQHFERPIPHCKYGSEEDGTCSHPKNMTPECTEDACPELDPNRDDGIPPEF